jgi:hypothetical protein
MWLVVGMGLVLIVVLFKREQEIIEDGARSLDREARKMHFQVCSSGFDRFSVMPSASLRCRPFAVSLMRSTCLPKRYDMLSRKIYVFTPRWVRHADSQKAPFDTSLIVLFVFHHFADDAGDENCRGRSHIKQHRVRVELGGVGGSIVFQLTRRCNCPFVTNISISILQLIKTGSTPSIEVSTPRLKTAQRLQQSSMLSARTSTKNP